MTETRGSGFVRGSGTTATRYRADIGAGSLKVSESRIIATLLLQRVTPVQFDAEISTKNVLQSRSPETARRLALLLHSRLKLMQPNLWKMVANGSAPVATHACLAAAVKHSPLLGDFMDLTLREQYRLFRTALSYPLWDHFVDDCRNRDPARSDWSESTISRLRSTVFAILAQAGYIENVRSLKLQTVYIAKEVLSYLHDQDEQYVLRCIEVGP